MNSPRLESSLERLLGAVSVGTAPILERALSGHDISVDEAARLFDADGSDLLAMIAAADELRARTVGDVVTYVINRNINFTNVCVKACGFCAFSRGHLAEEGYYLPVEEIIRRAQEAHDCCVRNTGTGAARGLGTGSAFGQAASGAVGSRSGPSNSAPARGTARPVVARPERCRRAGDGQNGLT